VLGLEPSVRTKGEVRLSVFLKMEAKGGVAATIRVQRTAKGNRLARLGGLSTLSDLLIDVHPNGHSPQGGGKINKVRDSRTDGGTRKRIQEGGGKIKRANTGYYSNFPQSKRPRLTESAKIT